MRTRSPNAEWAAAQHELGHSNLAPSCGLEPLEIVEKYLKGEHPLMRALRSRIVEHAADACPVLLVGETGTGKQQAARALHAAGPRRARKLVLASVGSLSPALAQSELFGFRRGAFTGADRDRKGFFIAARKSTLVLDDICDYPLSVQAMLLSSVEYGIVRPVGADDDDVSDARVVATTNRPLGAEVDAGRFRKDLYYRLSAGEIVIPPLRDHLSDLAIYCKDYLLRIALEAGEPLRTLSDGALSALSEHSWPGNVRELQNVLRRAVRASHAEILLGEHVRHEIHPQRSAAPAASLSVSTAEETLIRLALDEAHWNVMRAAKVLGFGRTKMYQRMAKYGIAR